MTKKYLFIYTCFVDPQIIKDIADATARDSGTPISEHVQLRDDQTVWQLVEEKLNNGTLMGTDPVCIVITLGQAQGEPTTWNTPPANWQPPGQIVEKLEGTVFGTQPPKPEGEEPR